MENNKEQPNNLESVVTNPAQLEQAMVEKALAEDPSGTPGDKAAAFFQKSAAELEVLVNHLSLRALRRMVMFVSTHPFTDKQYNIRKDSVEGKAAYRFDEMIWHKTIMQLQFEQQKALEAMEQGKKEHTLQLTKGAEETAPVEPSKGEE